jgi:hypothetical protein
MDVPRTLNAVMNLIRHQGYAGGLGLVIWANAVWDGIALADLEDCTGMSLRDIDAYVAALTTMEAAWLASGLIHEYRRRGEARTWRFIERALQELLERGHGERDLMEHAGPNGRFRERLRRQIANFADQIYAVQALSFAAIQSRSVAALRTADRIARRLIQLQGDLGQWWWHYDVRHGTIARSYPVFSVHQYGMAPMAFAALAVATGSRWSETIKFSHAWLRRNELGVSMVDDDAKTIWRSIDYDEGRLASMSRKAWSLVGSKHNSISDAPKPLKLNYETRPYEWGWCLYAGAIINGVKSERHIL